VPHQMLHHNRFLSFAVHIDAAQQAAMQTTYDQVVAFMMWCDVCLIGDQLQAVLGSDHGDVDGVTAAPQLLHHAPALQVAAWTGAGAQEKARS
jgi:hypothetical protein